MKGQIGTHFQTGLTLLELMIGIVMVAVLVTLAAPSFNEGIERRNVIGAAEDIIATVGNARSEAIRRNQVVSVTVTRTGATDWCLGLRNNDTAQGGCNCTVTNAAANNFCGFDDDLDGTAEVAAILTAAELSDVTLTSVPSFGGDTIFAFDPVQGTLRNLGDSGTFTLQSKYANYEIDIAINPAGNAAPCQTSSSATLEVPDMSMISKSRGFSVIEVMIALVLGIIVLVGLERTLISSLQANQQVLADTNLNQQLRASMESMTRDIRRSGYWARAMTDIGTGTQANPFINFLVIDRDADGNDDCVLYGYDRDNDGNSNDANEWRGFRLGVTGGVNTVQVKAAGGASTDNDCTEGTWTDFTDPNVVVIDDLTFVQPTGANVVRVVLDFDCSLTPTEEFVIYVREVTATLTGHLASDATRSRTLIDTVRLRNDRVATETPASATNCP